MSRRLVFVIVAALALACWGTPLAAQAPAQAPAPDKPVDMAKILAEIAGEYVFELQGQSLLVEFSVKDGKLFGAPPNETPEEIRPVDVKTLSFDVTVSTNGEYYQLQFVRNDKGLIDKCVMTIQGMVVEGAKVIK